MSLLGGVLFGRRFRTVRGRLRCYIGRGVLGDGCVRRALLTVATVAGCRATSHRFYLAGTAAGRRPSSCGTTGVC